MSLEKIRYDQVQFEQSLLETAIQISIAENEQFRKEMETSNRLIDRPSKRRGHTRLPVPGWPIKTSCCCVLGPARPQISGKEEQFQRKSKNLYMPHIPKSGSWGACLGASRHSTCTPKTNHSDY